MLFPQFCRNESWGGKGDVCFGHFHCFCAFPTPCLFCFLTFLQVWNEKTKTTSSIKSMLCQPLNLTFKNDVCRGAGEWEIHSADLSGFVSTVSGRKEVLLEGP